MGIEAFVKLVRENPSMYNVIWQALYIDEKLFIDYYKNSLKDMQAKLDRLKTRVKL